MKVHAALFCLYAFFLLQVGFIQADERADYIRENYTKHEKQIPMRDGVKLFTAIYMPNDTSTEYPILLLRTPYSVSPYGSDQYKSQISPHEAFEKEGFIFVYQDVRGRFMSETIRSGSTTRFMQKTNGSLPGDRMYWCFKLTFLTGT